MLLQSGRLALRSLHKHPGFAGGVIALVALGVGAVTSVWSVVDNVLLRALPYPDQERLVKFTDGSYPMPLFRQWQEAEQEVFSALGGAWVENFALSGGERPEQVRTAQITPGFFEVFAARPAHGRLLLEQDWEQGERVAVLSQRLFARRFAGAAAAAKNGALQRASLEGATVTLNGAPHAVVGVLDASFVPPEAITGREVHVWVPLPRAHRFADARNVYVLEVAGKLRLDASLEQAQSFVDALAERNAADFPDTDRSREGEARTTPLVPLGEATSRAAAGTLGLVLAAVGLLLLIAVANVACLFLARGTQRQREIAVLSALGASRRRLIAQMLVESMLLSALGGMVGFLLAHAAVSLFRRLAPVDLPRIDAIAVDLRVFLFAFGLSLVAGLSCGAVPALAASRTKLAAAFRESGASAAVAKQRLRSALVVAEVAMAVVLLSGAGLLFRSVLQLLAVEPGFQTQQLVRLGLERGSIEDDESAEADREQLLFVERLLEEVQSIPGVQQAAVGWAMPFDFTGGGRCCWRSSFRTSPDEDAEPVFSMVHPMTPEVFEVLGVEVLEGRVFDARDTSEDPASAVINRTMAKTLFPESEGRSALGASLYMRQGSMQVVGIVDDVRHYGLDAEPEEAVYVPYAVFGGGVPLVSLVARTTLPVEQLRDPLRQAVWSVDPDLPVLAIETMEGRVAQSIGEPKFFSLLFAVFAGVALVLAAGGVYAALLFVVSTRQREVGVRLALGALQRQILWMMMGRGMALVGSGAALGLLASVALTRYLEAMLFRTSAREPIAMVAGVVVLVLVGMVASYLPARRSAALDPVETLRAE